MPSPSPRLRATINKSQQSPTNAAKVAQAPAQTVAQSDSQKPRGNLSCGSANCKTSDFDERSHREIESKTIHFYYVWSVALSGIFLLRNPEKNRERERGRGRKNRQTTKRQCADSAGQRDRAGQGRVAQVAQWGDRKNVITANVSMQLVGLIFGCSSLLLVFLSRSNRKLSVILQIVWGIAPRDPKKRWMRYLHASLSGREETCQCDVYVGSIHWSLFELKIFSIYSLILHA